MAFCFAGGRFSEWIRPLQAWYRGAREPHARVPPRGVPRRLLASESGGVEGCDGDSSTGEGTFVGCGYDRVQGTEIAQKLLLPQRLHSW